MMSSMQFQRIKRMRTDNIYLIAVDDTTHNNNLQVCFKVAGSTANLYNVKLDFGKNRLDQFIECDCPDSTSHAFEHGVKCKHCCFVLLKVLKQPESSLVFKYLKPDQMAAIKNIYSNLTIALDLTNEEYRQKYIKLLKTNAIPGNNSHKAVDIAVEPLIDLSKLDATAECPICYDVLVVGNNKSGIESCKVCKNYVHTECIKKWLSSGKNSCVYCRSHWEKTSQPKPQRTMKQLIYKNNGYINLDNDIDSEHSSPLSSSRSGSRSDSSRGSDSDD